jgi:hypothetical protein
MQSGRVSASIAEIRQLSDNLSPCLEGLGGKFVFNVDETKFSDWTDAKPSRRLCMRIHAASDYNSNRLELEREINTRLYCRRWPGNEARFQVEFVCERDSVANDDVIDRRLDRHEYPMSA